MAYLLDTGEFKKMNNLTRKIEIDFGASVKLPDEFEHKLFDLLGEVCKEYECKNPDRTMWVFGMGGKILWNEQEPDYDMSILSIEVAEREKYSK